MGYDKWIKVKVDMIHADPISQGFVMSADKLKDLNLKNTVASIVTAEYVDKNYTRIKTSGDSFYILPSLFIMNLIMTAAITFTLSILVNLLFSRKIKKIRYGRLT